MRVDASPFLLVGTVYLGLHLVPPMPALARSLRLPSLISDKSFRGFSELLVRELNILEEALRKRDADLSECDGRLKNTVEDLEAEQDRRGSARETAVS